MKLEKLKFNKGQSLVELILAIGIFVFVILSLVFLILDSYLSGRLALEINKANFLAQEGLEAVRSIRDNSWSDLISGSHGLAISGGHWIFQGNSEDISDQLNGGSRIIEIEDIDKYRKKVTSRINWQFQGRAEEVKLESYLTNWQIISQIEIRKPTQSTDYAGRTTNDALAYDYPNGSTWATTRYDITKNPSITFYNWQLPTKTYTSLVLKYRYHADGATNDTYAVAYSTTGCNGQFFDLISPTSASAPDTTVSIDLPINQDLSLLCLKIYTKRVGASDGRRLYTRDIWTEGTFLP
jgi:Tfp pilus assembly protein PilV